MPLPSKDQFLFANMITIEILLQCVKNELSIEDAKLKENLMIAMSCMEASINRMKELLEKPAEPKSVCF